MGQSFRIFIYIWPIILFLSSHLTVLPPSPRSLLRCHSRDLWGYVHPYGVGPPSFVTPKKPSCVCAYINVFLNVRSRHLICTLLELSFCHLHCPWSVWLKTNFEFYSIWQIPGAQPSVPSISNLMFTFGSSCDGEFKKSSDRVTLAHCWIPISCTQ